MKVKNLLIVGVLSVVFLILSLFTAHNIVEHGNDYKTHMHEHVEVLDFKDRLLNGKEWTYAILGWESEEKIEIAMEKLELASQDYAASKNEAKYLIYYSLGFIILLIVLYTGGGNLLKALSGGLLAVSIICLYVGVFTPMLEISAYSEDLKIPIEVELSDVLSPVDATINSGIDYVSDYIGIDIPKADFAASLNKKVDLSPEFKGRMYYFHQSKSIAGLIEILFKDKNYLVAWAILSFSVLLPIIKLLLTGLITFIAPLRKNDTVMMIIKVIGKWSMADVFVVAAYLVFFSFSNMNVGIESESKTLIGLYFFFSYVIVSITSSIFIWLAIRKDTKIKLYELAL